MVNEDRTLRSLLGIQGNEFGVPQQEISYQNLIDNLNLITEEMIQKLNAVIISFANGEVFKKKRRRLMPKKPIVMWYRVTYISRLITIYCVTVVASALTRWKKY